SKLKVGENVLWAKDGNIENIKFIKMDVNPALTEKYWKLVAVNDIKITNKDFIETEPHIMFKSEFNHVRGNDGCNQFQGKFEIKGNKISFERMLSTLKACPDVFASTEFRKLLSEEITFEVKNDKLTLKTKNDTFQFEAVYF
ncbi:MAG TPA: META domain-containing protein, partial [Taishania sp.]|nr:META domain-containing protein [Taishania sp.]